MPRSNLIDMTGKKIGRLTVLDYVGKCKWRCVCECGVEKAIDGSMLRKDLTRSCGCLLMEHCKNVLSKTGIGKVPHNAQDLTGQKFYKLSAVRRIKGNRWLWRCDCGSAHEAAAGSVKSGGTQSCGCAHAQNLRQRNVWLNPKRRKPQYGDLQGSARMAARTKAYQKTPKGKARQQQSWTKRRMRVRSAEGKLTTEQWETICAAFEQRCAYCNCKPEKLARDHVLALTLGGQNFWQNIVPSCTRCNTRKSNLPLGKAMDRIGTDRDLFWSRVQKAEELMENV